MTARELIAIGVLRTNLAEASASGIDHVTVRVKDLRALIMEFDRLSKGARISPKEVAEKIHQLAQEDENDDIYGV